MTTYFNFLMSVVIHRPLKIGRRLGSRLLRPKKYLTLSLYNFSFILGKDQISINFLFFSFFSSLKGLMAHLLFMEYKRLFLIKT
jgi:hypothetical protein